LPEPLNGEGDLTLGATPAPPSGNPLSKVPVPGEATIAPATPAGVASPPPQIPDVEITKVLGKGGMGVVYAGRQSYLDRDVAVKVLSASLVDPSFAERFRREAKILAGMTHPNIVGCYSAGVTPNGVCYLVMEMIDGPSLAQRLREKGPLPASLALAVARDVAAALDHAHRARIIHRDVKPENVLLARRKGAADDDPFPFEVKLADLGLARSTAEDASMLDLTAKGAVLGTPTTMAPEQFEDPNAVDYRADIYGLGCVLFHSLTGRQAFPPQATLASTFSQKLSPKSPDPRALRADLDPRVAAFVMKLIAKDRAQRPQSYGEVIAACEQLAGGRPGATARTRPRWIPIAAGALFLGSAIAWKLFGGGGDPAEHEPVAPATPPVAPTVTVQALLDGKPVAAGEPVPEGATIELLATVEHAPEGATPGYLWKSLAPKEWKIEGEELQVATLVVPRGLKDGKLALELALHGPGGLDELVARPLLAVARDKLVAAIENELAASSSVDLPRRFALSNLGEGLDDDPTHSALEGPGPDLVAWSLPRGSFTVEAAFHLKNPHGEVDGKPEPTAGGLRIEFGDGVALQVHAATPDPRPASGRMWTVRIDECCAPTTLENVDPAAIWIDQDPGFALAPQESIPLEEQVEDGPTAVRDVLLCTVTWSELGEKLTVDVEQRREEQVGSAWIEQPQPRRTRRFERSRTAELERDPAFVPDRLVLWKNHGGLCIHRLDLRR
jgi:hypothetical protein